MINIKDKNWYFRLSKGDKCLLESKPWSYISNKMIVQMVTEKGRLFSYFDSPKSFLEYSKKFDKKDRHFHEVILGSLPQRPRFDIDLTEKSVDSSEVLDCLIDSIIDVCNSKNHFPKIFDY